MKNLYMKQPEIHWHNVGQSYRKNEHFKWCDSYCLGIKVIDDQHKRLLEFVNDLYNCDEINEGEEYIYFKEIIAQAVDYIKTHFATEEGIMLATRYPGYEEHKNFHNDFILKVVRSVRDYQAGKRLVINNFTHFLRNWVLSHIAIVDVGYIEYFKHIAILRSDGSLLLPQELTE
ncbi:MAG: bacteriohemerythrin [Treponema sp.]|nr:bacteriohemerythrin [Treponema sp.]